jgi:hypothetical protein
VAIKRPASTTYKALHDIGFSNDCCGFMFAVGAFMYRAETGHFPFLGGEHAASNPAQEPSHSATSTQITQPGPQAIERPSPVSTPEAATQPPRLYYTRVEIDAMLNSLGELQRFYKSKPAPSQAIERMIRRMVGNLMAPDLPEYPLIADGLEQYAQQLRDDASELQRLTKDADEFVRSAASLPAQPSFTFDPFYKTLLQAAEVVRGVATKTNDNGLAGAVIREQQRQVLDEYTKYSASIRSSIRSSQQKIAEKIADLRSR